MKHLILIAILCSALSPLAGLSAEKPNVLFIAADDLNHWVGYLGRNEQTKTPNIDRLAAKGMYFTRSYCVAPACNPSRVALMSGLRPSTSGVYDNGNRWKEFIPEEQTLSTQFLKAGYNVYGAGKIYHGSAHRGGEWTEYFTKAGGDKLQMHSSAKNDGVGGIKFYALANKDEDMPDYKVVSYGLEKLKQKHDKPFFLAIGLVKPHMPWSVPKKYFDQFPLDQIKLPPYQEDDLEDIPPAGVSMARPEGDHAQMLASDRWKEAIQAYLATTAFCDAMVGRLLDGLEQSEYRDNTIIVFWGDHGWHLGEKRHWRKFALWEEATRAPLIWVAPGVTKAGTSSEKPVDFLSIYPTLCDLTGIPTPTHVQGENIRPLLQDPNTAWTVPALTTHRRDNHSVRSEDWRYTRYANGDEELYNESEDPYEWNNLASDARYNSVKQELAKYFPRENVPPTPSGN